MSPRVGAYVCPRGVAGIEYRTTRAGIEVTKSFDVPARIESERQAMEQLLTALADAGIKRADLVLTLRGFGTVHHVLPMPPARDDLIAPIVAREIRKLEPALDAPTISWLPLPSDPTDATDGPSLRQVLAAAAPRHVVDTMETAIRGAGHRLAHLTVLPAAAQRLFEEFVGESEPAALVTPLRDGAFLGFFVSGALRLVVEPPLAPDEQHDAAALAEETELGAMFVRQQFRGAQLSRLVLAAPPDSLSDAEAAFTERLGVPVNRIAGNDLSSGGLIALGGVLDARSAAPLGLGTAQGKGAAGLAGSLRTASYASLALAAALAVFTLYTAHGARDAATRLRSARVQVEQASFGLAPIRQTVDQRKVVRDAVALIDLVQKERHALQQGLASLAGATAPAVRLDSVHLTQGVSGWITALAGTIPGESHARSVEMLHAFYRDLPTRMAVDELMLENLEYADGRVQNREPPSVRFRISFVIPFPKDS